MLLEELLKLPGGLIGAGAVLAAVISALTVLLGAFVKARTARAVAKDTFRRQLLYDNVKPFLERLNRQIAVYERLTEAGSVVVKELDSIGKATTEEAKVKMEAVRTLLTDLRQEILDTKELWNSTSGMSVIARDQRLVDTATTWLRSSHDFLNLLSGKTFGITAEPVRVSEMRKAAREAMWKAVQLRIELEEAVIQPRGWVRTQGYWVARWFRRSPPGSGV